MFQSIREFFKKDGNDNVQLPITEEQLFVLHLDNMVVGELSCRNGLWTFKYSKVFIYHSNKYYPIVGFPDVNKVYTSETLWPFFQVRIPGLGQPVVKEIIESEQIDINNEAELLKRFGHKTLTNPYVLSVQ